MKITLPIIYAALLAFGFFSVLLGIISNKNPKLFAFGQLMIVLAAIPTFYWLFGEVRF